MGTRSRSTPARCWYARDHRARHRASVPGRAPRSPRRGRGYSRRADAKRAVGDFEKRAFFPQNESLAFGQREVVARFWVGLEPEPVLLIGGEAVERDQPPGHIIGPLVRQEIAEQMASAPRD